MIDLLFHRYADPMKLLDLMIRNHQLLDFIRNTVGTINKEQEEKTIWELWLHKVSEETYGDFKDRIRNGEKSQTNARQLTETVNRSFEMLNRFTPEQPDENKQKGDEQNGC